MKLPTSENPEFLSYFTLSTIRERRKPLVILLPHLFCRESNETLPPINPHSSGVYILRFIYTPRSSGVEKYGQIRTKDLWF